MSSPAANPILDDFLAELERADPEATQPLAESVFEQRLIDLDRGLVRVSDSGDSEGADSTPRPPVYPGTDRDETTRSRVLLVVLVGWLLLMAGVGAAAAALVFHERVASILGY